MMKTIKPPALKKGDTIGLIAPASSITRPQYRNAIRQLANMGFRITFGRHILGKYGYLGGKDEERLNDLHGMFADEKVKGIWCARGGYGCQRLLPELDYDLIRNNPKILVGYSDITALSQAIYKKTGLVGFHGQLAYADFTEYTRNYLEKVFVEHEHPLIIQRYKGLDAEKDYQPQVIRAGIVEGELVGGNLSVLAGLSGTPYQVNAKGKIVFLEDISEKPYKVDRMLTQMLQTGQFEGVKGILLGVFVNCVSDAKSHFFPLIETFRDRLLNLGVPILYGFSFGHVDNMCTLPIGIKARLDTTAQTLTLLESSVCC